MPETKIKPQRGYLLVEQLDSDQVVQGLVVPDSEKDQSCRGRVIAIGGPTVDTIKKVFGLSNQIEHLGLNDGDRPSMKLTQDALELIREFTHEGDIVIYSRWKGMEIRDEKYKLVAYEDVMATEEVINA
jgi:co-chaperonin GroES (HSP10)